MIILAIETSCDETAISLVEAKGGLSCPQFKIIRHIVSSQVKLHAPFGGVVPMLAKREHQKNLPLVLKQAVKEKDIAGIDLIATTVGPGLEPALWEGINFAKDLGKAWGIPVLGVNHLEGHIYSNWIQKDCHSRAGGNPVPKLPAVCLIASGGHTILTYMPNLTSWKILGETLDDAVGECFDKVARMLELPYPGGPQIEIQAKKGDSAAINFPQPMLHSKNYDFSYSGLKTAVLYYLRDHKRANKSNVAASFQSAAFTPLVSKALRAAKEYKAKSILLCGGVASSRALRNLLRREAKKANLTFHAPGLKLNTDNASMIAAAAYINHLKKSPKKLPLKANGNLSV